MRPVLRFLFSAVGLLVASAVVPGVHHDAFADLLAVAVILGLLNATLGVLLKFIAFVPVVLSLGCFSLVINGLVFLLAGRLSEGLGLGFRVEGCGAAFLGALVTSLLSALLEGILLGKEQPRRPPPPPRVKLIN